METVELIPAYLWDCPDCGRENHQRSITTILDPNDDADADCIVGLYGEDHLEMARTPGGPRVSAQSTPKRVTCRHCSAEFKAAGHATPDADEASDS